MTKVEMEMLDRQGLLCWACDDAIIFEDSGKCLDCLFED